MSILPSPFRPGFLTLVCVLMFSVNVTAQQESGLIGSWQTKDGELVIRLTLNPDGTGTLDETPIKYTVKGTQLIVNEEGTINNYTFKLTGNVMVVSGGDLDSPLTFQRQGGGRGLGGRKNQAASGGEPKPKEKGLTGRWQSSQATVQINDDGTLVLDGKTYRYNVKSNVITIADSEGSMQFPFQLSGDSLNVLVNGEVVAYKRLAEGSGPAPVGGNVGANPPELFGKWCYMSNVNSGSGGRMSNRCFTLHENGTYEYYSETSSSGPVASSASQESDSGTWTASATTITRNSRTLGSETYPLEKRNHPKTGDPMLVLDGESYVTYSPRTPW
ncbi:MAG: hypothetical protein ABR568_08090 [Pyrinomonadaceae bacterium]